MVATSRYSRGAGKMIATCFTYQLKRFWCFKNVFENFGEPLPGFPLVAGLAVSLVVSHQGRPYL